MRLLFNRFFLIGLILIVAVGGVIYTKFFKPPPPPPPVTTGPVVVAKVPLLPRMVVTKDMVEVVTKEKEEILEGALTSDSDVVGLVVKEQVDPDQQLIRDEQFYGRLTDLGLPYLIPPDMRAMVVEIKVEPNFHDQVRVGNRFDIVATFEDELTTTLVENVEVLAVDNVVGDISVDARGPYTDEARQAHAAAVAAAREKGDPEPEGPPPIPPSVTLSLTAEDAEKLALAMDTATLDYVLRPIQEELPPEMLVVSPDGLVGEGAAEGDTTLASYVQARRGITLDDIAPGLRPPEEKPGRAAPTGPTRVITTMPSGPGPMPPPGPLDGGVGPTVSPPDGEPPVVSGPPMHQVEIITGTRGGAPSRSVVEVPDPGI